MSKLELIVLGMLNKNSMYGYEIVKFFKDTGFYTWMKIKLPSIYKVLTRLENKNMITGKKIIREDGIPKNQFFITNKGKKNYRKHLQSFVLKKSNLNFGEFLFFTMIMEKSVTKSTFINAVNIQIEQLDSNLSEVSQRHQAIKQFFPGKTFITESLRNNFQKIHELHSKMLNEIKRKALLKENSDYFLENGGVNEK